MAERVASATDPLNLMRIMPPQGARSFEAMRFRAWLFYLTTNEHEWGRGGTADYPDEYFEICPICPMCLIYVNRCIES
jgi:hypothetical protein